MPQNESGNIVSFHFLGEDQSLGEALLEKLANKILVVRDRGSHEPALGMHILFVLAQKLGPW
jgi:hypothetical protein